MELDHPSLHRYSDNDKSAMNFENNLNRIARIDKSNVVWYVVGFKRINRVSFFKFRTSLENNKVVMDMLNGKAPSCSIRVLGEFKPDASGVWRGKDIRFVTIDYVDNPGFQIATLFKGAIDLVKSGSNDLKKVEFTNNQNKTNSFALESKEDSEYLNKLISNKDVYMIDSTRLGLIEKDKVKRKKSFNSIMNSSDMLNLI